MSQQTDRARFVAALLAVIVLGGAGSAAAGGLITGHQIEDGTITSRDLKNGGISGADIRDGTLTVQVFDQASISGPEGPAGPAGAPGPRGPDGIPGVEHGQTAFTVLHEVDHHFAVQDETLTCPTPGRRAIAGGISSVNPHGLALLESTPIPSTGQWHLILHSQSPSDNSAFGWVTCIAG